MIAAAGGDVQKALSLMEQGAALDAVDSEGNTALILACLAGQESLAERLAAKGADVNIQPSSHGLTALMVACARGLDRLAPVLVKKGALVNARGKRGQTPLYFSIFSNKPSIVKMLLDAGADPNIADDKNQAPLYFAAHDGQQEAVRMLLAKGADVNVRGGDLQQDALMAASMAGEYEIAGMLMERGAKFHIPDAQGMTAMMFAAQQGHTDIVNLMLGRYAHPMLTPFVESAQEREAVKKPQSELGTGQ